MVDHELISEVRHVMKVAIGRTRCLFESEYGLSVTEADAGGGDLDSLTLFDMTAIIGMGGSVNLLIAFSFEEGLINALYRQMTSELDLVPAEIDRYREAAAGEIVNTILGHSTMDLQQKDGAIISMTPPVVLDRVKTIRRMKNAMFYTQSLNTVAGRMNISLVGPRELFDARLDYAK